MEWNKLGIKKKTTSMTSKMLNALEPCAVSENDCFTTSPHNPLSVNSTHYDTSLLTNSSLLAEAKRAEGINHWRRRNRPA